MANEDLNVTKIHEEIGRLRAETKHLNRPFYRRVEFWAIIAPVFSLFLLMFWGDYLSPVSEYKLAKLDATRAKLELDIGRFEEEKTILSEENDKLKRTNGKLFQENETAELSNAELSTKNDELKSENQSLNSTNRKLTKLSRDLRQQNYNSKEELEAAKDRLICKEIDLALRVTRIIAYNLGATLKQVNFDALRTIAVRNGYLRNDRANEIEMIGRGSWYRAWASGPFWSEDFITQGIAAQFLAQILAKAIDINAFFSPFADGTDADREYPLSRILDIVITEVDNDEAIMFLTAGVENLERAESPKGGSLMVNVSNDSMNAVLQVKWNEVHISKDHLVEFAMEAFRLKEAHSGGLRRFESVVMDKFSKECSDF